MFSDIFNFDSLSLIATILIIFVASIVITFSKKYLKGDRNQNKFYLLVFLISLSLITTFSVDNIFLFAGFWMINNLLLIQIMIHKKCWMAAVNSGHLAFKNFAIGFISLTTSLLILFNATNSTSITEIVHTTNLDPKIITISTILICISAMNQSALLPFHSWLISSLNSPTPASALMHAGLVNGGGLLLARFSQLIIKAPDIMNIIFVIGIATALIGTLWKLIQSNIKTMLACSTVSQMGFMIAQCGMGLFPAAIAHLFWHGMYKAYLFLSSANYANEKRFDLIKRPKISSFIVASICGIIGLIIFLKFSHINLELGQTTLAISILAFIVATQIALIILNNKITKNFILALTISAICSGLYGFSIEIVEHHLNAELLKPLPLNILHITCLSILVGIWLSKIFLSNKDFNNSKIMQRLYVKLLNASQANATTITSNRNSYNN